MVLRPGWIEKFLRSACSGAVVVLENVFGMGELSRGFRGDCRLCVCLSQQLLRGDRARRLRSGIFCGRFSSDGVWAGAENQS